MNYTLFLSLLLGYVAVLAVIGFVTARGGSNSTFFNANKNANWLLVSFGMIGASLSGVTFISVPGWTASSGLTYLPMVFGFLLGYLVIAFVLLPVYYRYNVISIYSFLGQRLGQQSYQTGSLFFLISRIVGASARLYIVTMVVQLMICDPLGIPFIITAVVLLALIALYSATGGIATIVITDSLQTALMLLAAGLTFYFVAEAVVPAEVSISEYLTSHKDWYFFQSGTSKAGWKQVLGGMFIAIAMTGLDQDMMQKNLTVSKLKNAQKNMVLLGVTLIFVNLMFLSLGILLTDFAELQGITATGDKLFALVAQSPELPAVLGVMFFLGLLAAAFSSADSALASLTTAFCIDFLSLSPKGSTKTRKMVYVGFMSVLLVVMTLIYSLEADSIISSLFTAAGYTYGPLLGLFVLALTSKANLRQWWVLPICIAAPLLTYGLSVWAPTVGYSIGFELLLYNGAITYLGLRLIARRSPVKA
ncbi:MAG: Sodium/glucose cotransporter [Cryomorphaceae bacterium]|nr:MAG: Sodium/glucose cotransporter [Cryomorphaceae bacterium]